MIGTEQATLPKESSAEKEQETISPECIVKYMEYDNNLKSLMIASIFDGDDPLKEALRVEEESKNVKGFLSKKEAKIVEFCSFRPNHHIATAFIGCKKGDEINMSINGMFFSCKVLDFFKSPRIL